ncbi:MAG: MerR family transcriptional regulator, partial [Lachnospiraceae bacterium]|nr:MerR family transcriptional regulator [Lachnospiraceae bacterium]
MLKLQISKLAKQTGVSVRTLHYYDTIGLLKPAEVDPITGYRFYDEASIEKLKEILYYRELNFALKDIPKLIEEKEFKRRQKLLEQRHTLQEKKKQLDQLLAFIDANLSKPATISPWFDKILADYHYSGFSYHVTTEETFCSWGMADYENDKPFTLSSRFPISSLSSDFIVFCTLLFEEKGLLNTEDFIGTYVPECRYGNTVTIRHLLDMSSGFSDELAEKWRSGQITCTEEIFYKRKTLETMLEIIHYAPLKFTPGTQVDPCGLNIELLG